jgi:hypothetical protein
MKYYSKLKQYQKSTIKKKAGLLRDSTGKDIKPIEIYSRSQLIERMNAAKFNGKANRNG